MAPKKSVIIIDDHSMFREGIRSILERDEFIVIGDASYGSEGLQKTKMLKPDVVLVDISLPDQNGLKLTRQITDLLPETHVIILSMHSKIDYIAEAFKAGAKGYVVKESAGDKLLQALKAVVKGEHFLDSSISAMVVKKLTGISIKESKHIANDYEKLTNREQEVLGLLAEGFSVKEISEKIFISQKTVENHRASIMRKLHIRTPVEIVRYAAKLGLVDLNVWES